MTEVGKPAIDVAESSDEKVLIEQARDDPNAVGELYRRHHEAIGLYIRRRVGCLHESEDLTADTFMAMVRNLPRYRSKGAPFRSWLYRIASTQVNRWARRRRRFAVKALLEISERTAETSTKSEGQFATEHIRLALLSISADSWRTLPSGRSR